MFLAQTAPPYYAVIFTSKRTEKEEKAYEQMASLMVELARKQPGFLGIESTRNAEGTGITVSYWESLEAIASWRNNTAHQQAQEKGKNSWYSNYAIRICKVERDY